MTIEKYKKNKKTDYIPYSTWIKDIIKNIDQLTDECLDRFANDKKTNTEILKMLSKLKTIIENKYKNE
jgi:hypothetical protein